MGLEEARERAKELYHSLNGKVLTNDEFVTMLQEAGMEAEIAFLAYIHLRYDLKFNIIAS